MIHVHDLNGCAPAPLAHYLKALAVLRLIAENPVHGDPNARGWWDGDKFRLATTLDKFAIEAFFLERYEPTPLVSPWNKGSGFFLPDDPGISPLENSVAPRFAGIRNGIAASRQLLDELAKADRVVRDIKAETKDKKLSRAQVAALKDSLDYKKRLGEAERVFKRLKAEIIPRYRLRWRGPHREWMDAAMVLGDDGKPKFPALLGTGGNDGRLDFTNNFFQRLGEAFDLSSAAGSPHLRTPAWVAGALWSDPVLGCRIGGAVGQYFPGMTGGANSANGPDGESLLNPVEFILMMEGAVLFTSHATRRLGVLESSRAAAPFAINANAAGYASASDEDESARGEQWMPLWSQPITLGMFKRLLSEGRAQIGVRPARESIDLARAVGQLGTTRGITSFQRFGYIERNGQSNLAVPLGRFSVSDQVLPRTTCLDDLSVWVGRLRGATRDEAGKEKSNSKRLRSTSHRFFDSLFRVIQHPEAPSRWQAVLSSMAEIEGVLASGRGFSKVGPIPELRPEWAECADDGTPEYRLALSFALQSGIFKGKNTAWQNSTRRHWLPLSKDNLSRFATTGAAGQLRLRIGPELVIRGRNGVDDAIALVERRLVEASQNGQRSLPLQAAPRSAASHGDIAQLISGDVNVDRCLSLGRALMAVDCDLWRQQILSISRPEKAEWPDDAWLAIRLALLPWPVRTPTGSAIRINADPAVFRRLVSGDAATAVDLALRRLRAIGIQTTVRAAAVAPDIARLWAAAVAFPISQQTAGAFLRRLDPKAIT